MACDYENGLIFVAEFEKRCPDIRMTSKERIALGELLAENTSKAWEGAIRSLVSGHPNKKLRNR